jgi:catechol 2,3-dioxygenase-like lactoylglutathione lyase family enzyme
MTIDRRTLLFGAATLAAGGTAEGVTADPGTAPVDTRAPVNTPAPTELPPERVLGIGGFFFKSHDPKTLAQWYQVHLGIDPLPTDYGHSAWRQAAGPTAFAPFPMATDYFGSPQQTFMLNFRVRSLDAMVAQLQKAHIEVKVDPKTYPNGRFARLHDPEDNPIELWEPANPS